MGNLQDENGEKPLREYVTPTFDCNMSSIKMPTVQANNFEIKLTLITMI